MVSRSHTLGQPPDTLINETEENAYPMVKMTDKLFKQAVKQYRDGQKSAAKTLLLQLVEQDELHEQAWLLLSVVVDASTERLTALQNAHYINPDNPKTRQTLIKLLTKQGIAAVKREEHQTGQDSLREALKLDANNAAAWLWLSRTNLDIDDQIFALKEVIRLKPDYQPAAQELDDLLTLRTDPFARAEYHLQRREYDHAESAYQQAIINSNGQQSSLAHQKLKELHARQQEEAIAPPPPENVTLIRLTIGPPLLYNMMLFIHSGLNPLRVAPVLFIAGGIVLFGSFLMVGTHLTPHHTLWKAILGRRGLQKPQRTALWITGLICAAIPFILLLTAAYRQYTLTAGQLPWAQ